MKLVTLLSGGIDSPVAAYVMAEAGAEIVLLHMDNRPYADERIIDQIQRLAETLREATGQDVPLHIAPHHLSQSAIAGCCDRSYQCVMCKRLMQRTAKEFAIRTGCKGIVMGDSLGQVASQTLRNIRSENIGLGFPVLRPLIGYDKLEIEEVAKRIGTYGISVEDVCGCTLVPPGPVTDADPVKIACFDRELDIDALVGSVAGEARTI